MSENWKQYNHGPNMGLLFYKRLYRQSEVIQNLVYATQNNAESLVLDIKDEKKSPFSEFYNALYEIDINQYTQITNPAAKEKFKLSTTYPGLLIGSGYTHDSNAIGDSKIGFYFDHTTGQPVIPGSSVKGVIRNIFELDRDKNDNKLTENESLEAIRFFLSEINESDDNLTAEVLSELKNEMFGFQDGKGSDTFFDSVISIDKSSSKTILGSDFITPHKHESRRELDPFVNPIPIQFIKVLPNIVFEFRFRLSDSKKYTKWNSELKCRLLKSIILTLGIGAKTNVGYGQFSEPSSIDYTGGQKTKSTKGMESNPSPGPSILDKCTQPNELVATKVKAGAKYEGIIIDSKNDNFLIQFEVGEEKVIFKKKKNKIKTNTGIPELNSKVNILIQDNFTNSPLTCQVTLIE